MSEISPGLLEALIDVKLTTELTIFLLRLTAAAAVFWVMDYFETLPDEVELIWFSSTSIVKTLFLLSRYLMPVHIIFNILGNILMTHSCKFGYLGPMISSFVAIAPCELLLYYQVYAFSQRNKVLGVFLFAQLAAVWCSLIILDITYLQTTSHVPTGLPIITCIPQERHRWIPGALFALCVYSVVALVVVNMGIVLVKYRNFKSALLCSFLSDGMRYLYAAAGLGIASTTLAFTARDSSKWILADLFACRMVIHLRLIGREQMQLSSKWDHEPQHTVVFAPVSSFHTNVDGEAGIPLQKVTRDITRCLTSTTGQDA
ncbi:hypothetical protein FA15DRAFT_694992 [Coprinopsis marcescibilis]|uniref:DUF6533 domain-containing protein n=1 Tax=Coprinopsis marcescibilis TaxID=230819 RepID=A0A5C3KUQ5_COPMA|nr:hypothetical protein FA15DRAFT_694992 [Coprinopsis marcescibilis]